MKISIVTLFPEMFVGPLGTSIIGRAVENGKIDLNIVHLRDFARDERGTVDEPPFGGGPGMVLQAGPLIDAVDSIGELSEQAGTGKPHVVLMSAQGAPLAHRRAQELSELQAMTIICGHYEGVDERFIELRVDEEISIGDFVLTIGASPFGPDRKSRTCIAQDAVGLGGPPTTSTRHILQFPAIDNRS